MLIAKTEAIAARLHADPSASDPGVPPVQLKDLGPANRMSPDAKQKRYRCLWSLCGETSIWLGKSIKESISS
jgi:hypothetical protein